MKFKPSNKILFTGAGFTKNFGGYLARDMWDKIFNSRILEKETKLLNMMKEDKHHDYETIYQNTMETDNFTKSEKDAFSNAVMGAYKDLDDEIRPWLYGGNSPYPVYKPLLDEMISRFAENNTQGFFFTLNQDLFIERKYMGRQPCSSPGFIWKPNFIDHNMRALEFTEAESITLPGSDDLEKNKEHILNTCRFMYIKLHGSYGWLSFDGSRRMVIGGRKLAQIQKEPILKWYYEIFNKILGRKNQKMLVIGYGFADKHINEVLSKSEGLRIFVISNQNSKHFKEMLIEQPFGKQLWQSVAKYYARDLKQIFPKNGRVSVDYKSIKRDFFDLNVR